MCYANTPSEEMEVEEPETAESAKSSNGYYMFLGDTVPSFYRRPHSSSDGLFTLIPCGERCLDRLAVGVNLDKEGGAPRNCAYMYLNGVFEK